MDVKVVNAKYSIHWPYVLAPIPCSHQQDYVLFINDFLCIIFSFSSSESKGPFNHVLRNQDLVFSDPPSPLWLLSVLRVIKNCNNCALNNYFSDWVSTDYLLVLLLTICNFGGHSNGGFRKIRLLTKINDYAFKHGNNWKIVVYLVNILWSAGQFCSKGFYLGFKVFKNCSYYPYVTKRVSFPCKIYHLILN